MGQLAALTTWGRAAWLRIWKLLGKPGTHRFRDGLTWVFFLTLVGGYFVSNWIADAVPFQILGRTVTNAMIRDAAEAGGRIDSGRHVALLTASPDDLDGYVRDPETLKKTICALLYDKPAAVVVDIDTGRPIFNNLVPPAARTPIVWARRVVERDDGLLSSLPVLGERGSDSELPAGNSTGLAAVEPEIGWSIRQFSGAFELADVGMRPSLHREAVCRYCDGNQDKCPNETRALCSSAPTAASAQSPFALSRYYDFPTRPASDLVPLVPADEMSRCLASTSENPYVPGGGESVERTMPGRVFVLGRVDPGGDRHRTIFGDQAGTWIVAAAIEAELRADRLSLLHWGATFLLDVCLALVVLFIHTHFRPAVALAASVGVLGALVYYGSVAALRWAAFEPSVVPFLVGIILEQLTSTAEDHTGQEKDKSAATPNAASEYAA